MHFRVNFMSMTSPDYNRGYDLSFIPCPCWCRGEDILINLNPKSPNYADVSGGCASLMELEKLAPPMRVTVVALQGGHGQEADLSSLVMDLESCGCEVEVLRSGFKD